MTNSLALSNAVYSLRDAGIIVVAACGNAATNTDVNPTYPASYPLDNVVSVAATASDDTLASWLELRGDQRSPCSARREHLLHLCGHG